MQAKDLLICCLALVSVSCEAKEEQLPSVLQCLGEVKFDWTGRPNVDYAKKLNWLGLVSRESVQANKLLLAIDYSKVEYLRFQAISDCKSAQSRVDILLDEAMQNANEKGLSSPEWRFVQRKLSVSDRLYGKDEYYSDIKSDDTFGNGFGCVQQLEFMSDNYLTSDDITSFLERLFTKAAAYHFPHLSYSNSYSYKHPVKKVTVDLVALGSCEGVSELFGALVRMESVAPSGNQMTLLQTRDIPMLPLPAPPPD